MATGLEQRPRYFEGQYLAAADLTAAVVYARAREARHLLGGHTWGIAAGLQLQDVAQPGGGSAVDVFIRPGYAWDGFGRPIVVLAPYQVPSALFQTIPYDPAQPQGQLIDVWLQYAESATQSPGPGFNDCISGDLSSRVVETFQVQIGPRRTPASLRDPVSVAGRSIDALTAYSAFVPTDGPLKDTSVPFQAFPDDSGNPALWLINVGQVLWVPSAIAGQPGAFGKRSDAQLAASEARRITIGIVAGSVLAADGSIVMSDRTRNFTADPYTTQDLVQVEGALRTRGDVRLWGTRVSFLDATGSDNGSPLALMRNADPSTGRTALEAQIGLAAGASGTNRFAVGTYDTAAKAFKDVFVVLDNGNVGIGTSTPGAPLQLPAGGLQIGASATSSENFFISSDVVGGQRGLRIYDGNFGAGTNLVTILAGGNVGIGTPGPVAPLHLPENGLQIGTSGTAGKNFFVVSSVDAAGARGLRFYNGNANAPGTHVMTVLASGNVGLGPFATNPSVALEIQARDFGGPSNPLVLHLWGSTVGDIGAGVLFLRSGGNVVAVDKPTDLFGVRTNAPTQPLDVRGNALLLSDQNPLLFDSQFSSFPDGAANRAELANDTGTFKGLVIAGNRSGGATRRVVVLDDLEVKGDLVVRGSASKPGGGSWGDSSDLALKTNIEPLANALGQLLRLRGVRFEWKDARGIGGLEGPQAGLIAQEVEAVFPSWVGRGPDGQREVTVRGFEALAVEALRELSGQVEALRSQVAELRSRFREAGATGEGG
jgi:hypothetical protein